MFNIKFFYTLFNPKKAKDNEAHNDTPHLLSRGGYKLLEQEMLEEKIKAQSTSIEKMNSEDSLSPPSPPPRHKMWKGARIKPSGTWSSKSTEQTVERIVSLTISFQCVILNSMCYFKFNVLKFVNFFSFVLGFS